MAITRANAATYLNADFSSLAEAIGQTANDESATGYGPDIDNALRALGTAEADLASATVADGDREKLYAAATYYAARRYHRQLSSRPNVSIENDRFDFQHMLKAVKQTMDDAKVEAETLGVNLSAGGVLTLTHMTLDWAEPQDLS